MVTQVSHGALEFALRCADEMDRIAMASFRTRTLRVETKADLSPVTQVDRDVEQLLRDRVAHERPSELVIGEEYGGDRTAEAEWRWIIDPIDGTRSFVRGNETWAILIALQHLGRTQVAVASVPSLRARYHAVRGEGAVCNGRRLQVSRIDRLDDALITHTSVRGFVRTGQSERFLQLAARCWDARGVGNSLTHLLVARGTADVGWTSRANVWDFAALSLIVTEAGGRFTDRSGDDPVLGGTGISSNGLLHERVLQLAEVQEA